MEKNLMVINGVYYFRSRIPVDMVKWFDNQDHIKKSLKTKSLTVAKRMLKVLNYKTEECFTLIRTGMLTTEQIQKLADNFKRQSLDSAEDYRATSKPLSHSQADDQLDLLVDIQSDHKEALCLNNLSVIKSTTDSVIHDNGLGDLSEDEYQKLSRELLKRVIEVFEIEKERTKGNYDNEYDRSNQPEALGTVFNTQPIPESSSNTENVLQSLSGACRPTLGSLKLSEAIEVYLSELKTMEKAGVDSLYEAETKCNQFLRIIKDKPVSDITRSDIVAFMDVLKRLPTNMSKRFKGMSIEDVLAVRKIDSKGNSDTLSPTTINNYLTRIKAFLTWCVRNDYLNKNPADGVTFGKKSLQRPDELRKAYAKEDLIKLIQSYSDLAKTNPSLLTGRPERLWLPLIALYSGMRLNEIAQLHSEDIQQEAESGIWYFNVDTTDDDDKKVKSASSRRMIPIHPELIKMGLLEHVKTIKESGEPRYWMNLSQTGRGYHKSFANWFLGNGNGKGFLRKYVTEDSKINFHSFRHTFQNELKQKLVPESVVNELVGHSQDSLSLGRYGKPYLLKTRLEAIKKLAYGINLKPLQEVIKLTKGELKVKA